MSIESAEEFLQKMKKDKALQEKIYVGDSEDESFPGDPDFRSEKKFFHIVTAAGFDFTKEEWIKVANKNSNLLLEKKSISQYLYDKLLEAWTSLAPGMTFGFANIS